MKITMDRNDFIKEHKHLVPLLKSGSLKERKAEASKQAAELQQYLKGKEMKHPGFKSVQAKIAKSGYSMKSAGAILANASRHASAKAKAKNPRLKRVGGEDHDFATEAKRRGK